MGHAVFGPVDSGDFLALLALSEPGKFLVPLLLKCHPIAVLCVPQLLEGAKGKRIHRIQSALNKTCTSHDFLVFHAGTHCAETIPPEPTHFGARSDLTATGWPSCSRCCRARVRTLAWASDPDPDPVRLRQRIASQHR